MVRGFFPQGRNLSLVTNTNYPPQNSSSGSAGSLGDNIQVTLPPQYDLSYSHYQFCQIPLGTIPIQDRETFYPIPVKGSFGPGVLQSEIDIRVFNDFVDDEVEFDNFNADFVNNESPTFATGSQGMDFSADGLDVVVAHGSINELRQHALTIPFDPSTLQVPHDFTINLAADGITNPLSVKFVNDGNKLLVIGFGATKGIFVYDTSANPYSIDGATIDSGNSLDYTGQTDTIRGFAMSPDGMTLLTVDVTNEDFIQYTLTTPFQLDTANISSPTIVDISQFITPVSLRAFAVLEIGLKEGMTLFLINSDGVDSTLEQFEMSTAYDINTISYSGKTFVVGSEDTSPTDIALSTDCTLMLLLGFINNKIFRYENKIRTDEALDFEIVEADATTGDYLLYVNIPQLRDYELFQVLGGNAAASNLSDGPATFPARFKSVKHLTDIVSAQVAESTNQSGIGDVTGDVVESVGVLGKELRFNETVIDGFIDEPSTANYPIGETAKTMAVWLALDGTGSAIRMAVSYGTDTADNSMEIGKIDDDALMRLGSGNSAAEDGALAPDLSYHKLVMVFEGNSPTFDTKMYVDGVLVTASLSGVGDLIANLSLIGKSVSTGEFWKGFLRGKTLQDIAQSAVTIKIDFDAENDPDNFWQKTPVLETGENLFLIDNLDNNIITSSGVQTPPTYDLPSYVINDINQPITETTVPRQFLMFPDKTGALLLDGGVDKIIEFKYNQKGDITTKEVVREFLVGPFGINTARGMAVAQTPAGDFKVIIMNNNSTLYQFSLPNATATNYSILNIFDDNVPKTIDTIAQARSITMKSDDCSKIYIIADSDEEVQQFILPNPGTIVGMSSTPETTLELIGIEGSPMGIDWNEDGTLFFILGTINDRVFKVTPDVPWDLTNVDSPPYQEGVDLSFYVTFGSIQFDSQNERILRFVARGAIDQVVELEIP